MSCKVDSVGFCSCPPLPLAYLSSKWRLMHAKRGILYERIFKMQRFSKSGEFFFGWKKQQQPFMYILTSQLEQVEKEFIAFYALKWIDKRPPLRQFQIHSHYTKKIRASTVQVQFFCATEVHSWTFVYFFAAKRPEDVIRFEAWN